MNSALAAEVDFSNTELLCVTVACVAHIPVLMEVFSFDQLTLLSDTVLLFVGVQVDSNGCSLKSANYRSIFTALSSSLVH
jgi:hypothetical protein